MDEGFSFSGISSQRTGTTAERRGAPPAGSLPCLFSNNFNEWNGEAVSVRDREGLKEALHGWNKLQNAHKRTATALAANVEIFVKRFGRDNVGVITITFADHVLDAREAQRRFKSLETGALVKHYRGFIKVMERQKSGRVHYHVLLACSRDIRSGADLRAIFERDDYRTANQALRSEWALWRSLARRYGLGRCRVEPIKSTVEAVKFYLGKYVSKHVGCRVAADRGVRLVSMGGDVKDKALWWSSRFSPEATFQRNEETGEPERKVLVGGWLWRKKVDAVFVGMLGLPRGDMYVIKKLWGRRWAYVLARVIQAVDLAAQPGGVVYPTFAHAEADGVFDEEIPEKATELHVSATDKNWQNTNRLGKLSNEKIVRLLIANLQPEFREQARLWFAWDGDGPESSSPGVTADEWERNGALPDVACSGPSLANSWTDLGFDRPSVPGVVGGCSVLGSVPVRRELLPHVSVADLQAWVESVCPPGEKPSVFTSDRGPVVSFAWPSELADTGRGEHEGIGSSSAGWSFAATDSEESFPMVLETAWQNVVGGESPPGDCGCVLGVGNPSSPPPKSKGETPENRTTFGSSENSTR